MSYKKLFSGSAAAAALLLAGCSIPQEFYVMPDPTQPSAKLKIVGGYGWSVQRTDVNCSRLGQSDSRKVTYLADFPEVRHYTKLPDPVEVTLPAGLSTFETTFDRRGTTCYVNFDSLLMAGKKYEMQLDYEYRFIGPKLCKAIVFDLETGIAAPMFYPDFSNASLFFPNRAAIRDEQACQRRAALLSNGSEFNNGGSINERVLN
jgi:hypothetical protein